MCYFTFPSTYWALTGECLLRERGFAVKLRPVPRTLSSSCGICLELPLALAAEVQEAVRLLGIDADGPFNHDGKPVRESCRRPGGNNIDYLP
ncbi:MAG: DUF3343 domain-containing protein [Bacillota bacterium]